MLILIYNLKNDIFMGNIDLFIRINENKGVIIDYKNGNPYYHNFLQLKSYAVFLFKKFPELKELVLIEYFIKENQLFKNLYLRSEAMLLEKKIINNIENIEKTTFFEKNKESCKFCMYKIHCDNYTKINEKMEILNIKKDIFMVGNYSSEKIILINNKEISFENTKQLLNNINSNNYLIMFLNDNIEKNLLIKLLNNIKKSIIYFIGKKSYTFFFQKENSEYKNLISFNKKDFVKSYIVEKENIEKIGVEYV